MFVGIPKEVFMWIISSQKDIDRAEQQRALVGVYVDRSYNRERISWLLDAKEGFDEHARDAWHLLLPMKHGGMSGYQYERVVTAESYSSQLAGAIIDKLEIRFADLPYIVFRSKGQEFFYLKLGGKNRDQFFEEIGRVADLARQCQTESTSDGQAFRDYVTMQVANHLRRRRALSATRSALPALSALLGSMVDFSELV
jgi:hypothetical protein